MGQKEVVLYTDGACRGNPGPGGWGYVLLYGPHRKAASGHAAETTNNRMELQAIVEGLNALKQPCKVHIHSDSAYVVNAFKQGWIQNWQRNGWRTGKKEPVKNEDLWKALLAASLRHTIAWVKVKGHADDELNNEVDALAVEASHGRTV